MTDEQILDPIVSEDTPEGGETPETPGSDTPETPSEGGETTEGGEQTE